MFNKKYEFAGAGLRPISTDSDNCNESWCNKGKVIGRLGRHVVECHDEIDRLERENKKLQQMLPEKEFAITMENSRKFVIYRTARTPGEAEEMAMKDAGKFGEGEHRVISTNAY